jgi:hypothetical protein
MQSARAASSLASKYAAPLKMRLPGRTGGKIVTGNLKRNDSEMGLVQTQLCFRLTCLLMACLALLLALRQKDPGVLVVAAWCLLH